MNPYLNLESLFKMIPDYIVITDLNYMVMEYNFSVCPIFKNIKKGNKITRDLKDVRCGAREIKIKESYYHLTVTPFEKGVKQGGYTFWIKDITVEKKMVQQSEEKGRQLKQLNEELKETARALLKYSAYVEDASRRQERGRISREVHDNLGHTLTVLHTISKMVGILYKDKPGQAFELLDEGIKVCMEALGQTNYEQDSASLPALLRGLADLKFFDVKLTIDGVETEKFYPYYHVLYRVCKEALSNALKHSGSKELYIYLKYGEDDLTMKIKDNGAGKTGEVLPGFGLSSMRCRIQEINGDISFTHPIGEGFEIDIYIPLASV